MTRDVVPYVAGDCDDTAVDGDSQWCQRYSGPDRARVGVPVALSTELCRVGRSAGTATFASTREADLHIYTRDGSATSQWRWSTGRVFTPRHTTISIKPSTCLRWTTTWTTRTDRGTLIKPGVYTLRDEVAANTGGAGIKVIREREFTVEA